MDNGNPWGAPAFQLEFRFFVPISSSTVAGGVR